MNYEKMMEILLKVANSEIEDNIRSKAIEAYNNLDENPNLYVGISYQLLLSLCESLLEEIEERERMIKNNPAQMLIDMLVGIDSENVKVLSFNEFIKSMMPDEEVKNEPKETETQSEIPVITVTRTVKTVPVCKIIGFPEVSATKEGYLVIPSECDLTSFFIELKFVNSTTFADGKQVVAFENNFSWDKINNGFIVLDKVIEMNVSVG